jgi:hypothetical protein
MAPDEMANLGFRIELPKEVASRERKEKEGFVAGTERLREK